MSNSVDQFVEAQRDAVANGDRRQLYFERFLPHAVSSVLAMFAAAVLTLVGSPHVIIAAILDAVLPTAITVAAVLAGFLGTSVSLIVTLVDRPVMATLEAIGARERLFRYCFGSIRWLIAFGLIGVLALSVSTGFEQESAAPSLSKVIYALAVANVWIGTLAIATAARVVFLMHTILTHQDTSPEALGLKPPTKPD